MATTGVNVFNPRIQNDTRINTYNNINLNMFGEKVYSPLQSVSSVYVKGYSYDDNLVSRKATESSGFSAVCGGLNLDYYHEVIDKLKMEKIKRNSVTYDLSLYIKNYEINAASIMCDGDNMVKKIEQKKQLFSRLIEDTKSVFSKSPRSDEPSVANGAKAVEPNKKQSPPSIERTYRLLNDGIRSDNVTAPKLPSTSLLPSENRVMYRIKFAKNTYKLYFRKSDPIRYCSFGFITVEKVADKYVIQMLNESFLVIGFDENAKEAVVNKIESFEDAEFSEYIIKSHAKVQNVEDYCYACPPPPYTYVRLLKTENLNLVYHWNDNTILPSVDVKAAFEKDLRREILLPVVQKIPYEIVQRCKVVNTEPWQSIAAIAAVRQSQFECGTLDKEVLSSQERYELLYGNAEEVNESNLKELDLPQDNVQKNIGAVVLTSNYFTACQTSNPVLQLIASENADFISVCVLSTFSDGIHTMRMAFSKEISDQIIEDGLHRVKHNSYPVIKILKAAYGQYESAEIVVIEDYQVLSRCALIGRQQKMDDTNSERFMTLFKESLLN